jgi:hypothetical protein
MSRLRGHWLNSTLSIFSRQLERKVKLTPAVQFLMLPRGNSQVKPGTVCSVAGWGKMVPTGKSSDELREVELTVQKDQECKSCFSIYNNTSQMCVGDPNIRNASFQVRLSICLSWLWGKGFGKIENLETQASEDSFAHKAVSLPPTSWSRKKLGPLSLTKGSLLNTIP